MLDGVSQLGRDRVTHTQLDYTHIHATFHPGTRRVQGSVLKEQMNDNKDTCGARKILPRSVVKRVHGKAAIGATPCSHKYQAVRRRRVYSRDRGKIDHLVKLETCRKKLFEEMLCLMLINPVRSCTRRYCRIKRSHCLFMSCCAVGIKMAAINKVPLLPVLWRYCNICHLGILDPVLEKAKPSSGIYVVGTHLYVSA